MNSKQLFDDFVFQVSGPDDDDARAIAFRVFEKLFGLSRSDIVAGKAIEDADAAALQTVGERIIRGEPVQYILNEEYFLGRKFFVDRNVLIPRPETEELVRFAIEDLRQRKGVLRIFDIGTGSGCIPVSLSLEFPKAEVFASDVSESALRVARENASRLNANVTFFHHDILKQDLPVIDLDAMISNPPYIPPSEKASMNRNVLNYEPHQALFVPEEDPLLFYKAIAVSAGTHLKSGGLLLVEINSRFGQSVKSMFESHGLKRVQVLRDMIGNDRMVKAFHA